MVFTGKVLVFATLARLLAHQRVIRNSERDAAQLLEQRERRPVTT